MTTEVEIRNIEDLLSPLLVNGKKLVSYDYDRLLPPGENYGSVMLKLKVILEDPNGEEIVHCVAKLVPPTPYLWKMFNTAVTFKKEIGIYKIIGPTLNDFGREQGIENLLPQFPDYVGARISLDPESDEVDFDAVLILKNLTHDGYVVGDRFEGFDKSTMELLLRDLAKLHASVIAFKMAKPEEFKKKIYSLINSEMPFDFNEESVLKIADQVILALAKNKECLHLIEKIGPLMKKMHNHYACSPNVREPFATLVHNDFWTNNMMVKFEDGKPVSTKFLDFQIVQYDNPLNDVLFLIYSSARFELLTEVDEFLDVYYEHFIKVLKQLQCDITSFTKEAFMQELKAATEKELIHIAFMLQPLFTKKGEVKELSEMTGDDDMIFSNDTLHENYYPRIQFIFKDFFERGWVE